LVNKGLALYDLGKYNESVTQYNYALDLNPDDSSAMFNKGLALVKLGKYDEAITQ